MLSWLTHFGLSRFFSLLIAAGYLVIAFFFEEPGSRVGRLGFVLAVAGYLLIPLLCIWFGDEMGEYTGALPGPAMNKSTPGWLVRLGGWFLLLLPAILGLFVQFDMFP